MTEPFMMYYGCWDDSGHYYFDEHGMSMNRRATAAKLPWGLYDVDGNMQPRGHQREGEALLACKGGWTLLTFWDRTIDTRSGSLSGYFAEGTFTFDEMVELAKTRFAKRWNKMKFQVKPAAEGGACST